MAVTLKAARINAGYNSADTAAPELGVSANVVRNWEAGRTLPDVLQLKAIERVYHISYNDLIFLPANNA